MRDLITAYHEAGHGLARYAANKAIEQIRVLTDEQQQAYSRELGKAVALGGLRGDYLFTAPVLFKSAGTGNWQDRVPDSYTMNEAMSYLRCCYAGAAAEALYRGLSIEHPLVAEGCVSDMARADRCISEFWSPADKFRKRLHKEARELAWRCVHATRGGRPSKPWLIV